MSQRKKRLEKLITQRTREVDSRLARLAEQRQSELAASQQLEAERAQFEHANSARLAAISRTFEVNRLTEANDWLMSCHRRRELAEQKLLRAQRAVAEAQARVVAAKNDLKKIELLAERLLAEERKQAERGEQRMSDEFAALRFAENDKRRGEP